MLPFEVGLGGECFVGDRPVAAEGKGDGWWELACWPGKIWVGEDDGACGGEDLGACQVCMLGPLFTLLEVEEFAVGLVLVIGVSIGVPARGDDILKEMRRWLPSLEPGRCPVAVMCAP